MKKHKFRRRFRKAKSEENKKQFYPENHIHCMSGACRRAKRCLGRAYICGCTINYVAVYQRSDTEKLRGIRKAIDTLQKREARRMARGLPPTPSSDPRLDDPNLDPCEADRIFYKEVLPKQIKELERKRWSKGKS